MTASVTNHPLSAQPHKAEQFHPNKCNRDPLFPISWEIRSDSRQSVFIVVNTARALLCAYKQRSDRPRRLERRQGATSAAGAAGSGQTASLTTRKPPRFYSWPCLSPLDLVEHVTSAGLGGGARARPGAESPGWPRVGCAARSPHSRRWSSQSSVHRRWGKAVSKLSL